MRRLAKLLVPTVAGSLLLSACGSSSYSTGSAQGGGQPVAQSASTASVKTASNQALGTILVDGQGMTLYHLSGEHAGKFICSGSCLSAWHPLRVSQGVTPAGVGVTLGTVRRPEGTLQVTYQGQPLYTFASDGKPGETKGQGLKDVGTWSVLKSASQAGEPASSGAPPASSSSGEASPAGEEGAGSSYNY